MSFRRLLIPLLIWTACVSARGQSVSNVSSLPATTASSHLTPYTAFAWAGPSLGGPAHVSPLIWVESRSMPGLVARQLKALPDGKRAILIWHAQEQIWGDHEDALGTFQSPWLDHGATKRAAWFGSVLDGLVKSGTSVDFLVTDAEVNLSIWSIQRPQIDAIGADPRYAALAEQFKIMSLADVGNLQHWDVCAAWNEAMNGTIAGYFHAAYTAPLRARFPEAGSSEYNDMIIPAALAARARDLNGWVQPGDGPLFGTHQSPAMYGQVRQLANAGRNDGTDPDFAKNPLATIAWEAGVMRALVAGSTHPIIPWCCYRSWRGDNAGSTPLAGTAYWDEMFYQCMLSGGCVNCLFWDPKAPPADVKAMDEVLSELQLQTRDSPTLKPIQNDAVPFNSTTIVSGAICADGHKIYRVTVMPGATSTTVTLPSETKPITIAIPPGQVGVWVTEH